MSKEQSLEDKDNALHIGGVVNSMCTSKNSVIFAYGKAYTSFEELKQDHNEIQKNPTALLSILNRINN